MKTILTFTTLLCLAVCMHGQTFFYLESITFSPDPLNPADEVCVTVTGNKSTPCIYLTESGLTEDNGNLILNMCFADTPCSQVITPWDTTFCYGFLEPGEFTLTLDGCNYDGIGNVYEAEVINGDGSNNPFADFEFDTFEGCAPLEVNFTSTAVNADTYEWDFGDGSTSNEENPIHTYTEQGTYTVTLTVYDSDDPENISTAEFIDAINVNNELVVSLGEDITIGPNDVITLEAFTNLPDVTYIWNDGSGLQTLTVDASELTPGETYEFFVSVMFGDESCAGSDSVLVTIDFADNTTELAEHQLRFYPNPVEGTLFFNEELSKVKLFDTKGRLLGQYNNVSTIDTAQLPKGVYFLSLEQNGLTGQGKFLKL